MTSITNPSGPTTWPGNAPLTVDQSAAHVDPHRAVRVDLADVPAVPAGTTTAVAQATIEAIANQFEKHINSINAADFSPDGLRGQINAFGDTPAGKAIDAVVDTVQRRRDAAETAVNDARRELSPEGDTAAELRNSRFWDRTRRVLDASADGKVSKVAEAMIAEARPEQLGVLAEELGAYFTSRGLSTAWVDAILAQAAPNYAAARKQLTRAEKALTITKFNAAQLRDRVSNLAAPAAYRRPLFVNARDHDPD